MDLRTKVIEAINNGKPVYSLSKIFSISLKTLYRWKSKYKKTGSVAPANNKKSGVKTIIQDLDQFANFVKEKPDRTQAEMAKIWGGVSARTISSALKKAGFTYKKNFWIQTKR